MYNRKKNLIVQYRKKNLLMMHMQTLRKLNQSSETIPVTVMGASDKNRRLSYLFSVSVKEVIESPGICPETPTTAVLEQQVNSGVAEGRIWIFLKNNRMPWAGRVNITSWPCKSNLRPPYIMMGSSSCHHQTWVSNQCNRGRPEDQQQQQKID